MGTAVMGFGAGLLAGGLLVACGGGGDLVEHVGKAERAAVMVCAADDQQCQEAAAFASVRRCVLQPAGHLLYMGNVNDSVLREVLRERGHWSSNGREWIEGEDCV